MRQTVGCVAAMLVAVSASAQVEVESGFSTNPGQFMTRVDSVGGVVILYRDATSEDREAVTRIGLDGRRSGPKLSPLADFPDASAVHIWDAAAAPDGTTVLAAVVEYLGGKGLEARHVLLTYDANGKLNRQWEMYPYHHHQVAITADGTVYALGHRLDGPREPYPLMIKYTKEGVVGAEGLLSSECPTGDRVVDASDTDQTQFGFAGERLFVYVGPSREMRWLDADLKPVAATVLGLADVNGVANASMHVRRAAFLSEKAAALELATAFDPSCGRTATKCDVTRAIGVAGLSAASGMTWKTITNAVGCSVGVRRHQRRECHTRRAKRVCSPHFAGCAAPAMTPCSSWPCHFGSCGNSLCQPHALPDESICEGGRLSGDQRAL